MFENNNVYLTCKSYILLSSQAWIKPGVFIPNLPITFQLVREKTTWSQKDLYLKSDKLCELTRLCLSLCRGLGSRALRLWKSMDVHILTQNDIVQSALKGSHPYRGLKFDPWYTRPHFVAIGKIGVITPPTEEVVRSKVSSGIMQCMVGLLYLHAPHPQTQATTDPKHLGMKIPESSKRHNLNLPCTGNYLHSMHTEFTTI